MKLRRSVVVPVAVVALLAACGDDDDTAEAGGTETTAAAAEDGATETTAAAAGDGATETTAAAEGGATITIASFAFGDPITVAAGETVQVVNDDTAPHTLTADDGTFDTGPLDAGATAEFTVDAAGTYTFHCDIHPNMTGEITVS